MEPKKDAGKRTPQEMSQRIFIRLIQREAKGGGKLGGGWKTYRKFGVKPLPKNVFGPPAYDTSSPPPPPFLATLCHFPQKKEAPTRPTPISEASKSGFGEHTLQYVSPPPNSRDTFCPLLSRCPNHCKAPVQGRKKSTKINFLGPETAQWGGRLPLEGVVAENFVPALESLSSLGFEERNLGCPGNFAGMSRTPGGVFRLFRFFPFPFFS